MNTKTNLTQGSVTKTLLMFTLPIAATLLLQTLYGAADLLIVGKFSSVADVNGVTIGSQNMQLLTAFCSGLAVGSTILIGRSIGEKKPEQANIIINTSTVIFAVLSMTIMAVMLLFNNQIVTLLKTPTQAFSQTSNYLYICTLGIPLIFAYNVFGSIFRGIGDSKTPLIAVLIACITNIILDLILVAVFGLGSAGAAVATVLAQGLSVLVSVTRLKQHGIKIGVKKFQKKYIKEILNLGLPVSFQSMITTLSFVFITITINQYDNIVFSAAVGISEKICGIIMLVPISFMQSIAAYVAQNMGAGHPDRSKQALKIGFTCSFSFGLVMSAIAFSNGEFFAKLFGDDPEVIAAVGIYLKSYALDVLQVPVIFCLGGFFNGLGKTRFTMILAGLVSVFVRAPLVYMFSTLFPASLFHIGLGIPLATSVEVVACTIYLRILLKNLPTHEPQLSENN